MHRTIRSEMCAEEVKKEGEQQRLAGVFLGTRSFEKKHGESTWTRLRWAAAHMASLRYCVRVFCRFCPAGIVSALLSVQPVNSRGRHLGILRAVRNAVATSCSSLLFRSSRNWIPKTKKKKKWKKKEIVLDPLWSVISCSSNSFLQPLTKIFEHTDHRKLLHRFCQRTNSFNYSN